MRAHGSGQRRILRASSPDGRVWSDQFPAWSPDGRWIAFSSNVGANTGNGLLFVVRPDGSDETQITPDTRAQNLYPDWQPACTVRGSTRPDRMRGTRRADLVCGLGGADVLSGGAGSDRIFGGDGDDRISARDGAFDVVGCGPGRDSVVADRRDLVGADCELVSRA